MKFNLIPKMEDSYLQNHIILKIKNFITSTYLKLENNLLSTLILLQRPKMTKLNMRAHFSVLYQFI